MTYANSQDVARRALTQIARNYRWFSLPDDETELRDLTRMWAYAFSKVRYPEFVWARALGSILSTAKAGDNPPMPGDVLHHCRLVVDSLHGDELRQIEQLRAERKAEQDRELARKRPKN